MKPLTRSKQDYLKALNALAPGGEVVATSQLAARLGVSAPSVTNMLRRLAGEGLISHAPRAGARLSARGRKVAVLVLRRHRILETFLVQVLGFDWSEVHEDAEILEHHISDRVLEAIDRLIGHPSEDPHGHVIPDRNGKVRRRVLRPLAAVPKGARATVREIRDANHARMARWKDLGLVPGAVIRMTDIRVLEDVFEIEIDGRSTISGGEGLEGLMVEMEGTSTSRRSTPRHRQRAIRRKS